MKINHIFTLEKQEIEKRLNVTIYMEEQLVGSEIYETCIDKIVNKKTGEQIFQDDLVEALVEQLKKESIIPLNIDEFSYEIPQCGRVGKQTNFSQNNELSIVLSYVEIIKNK